MAHLYQHVPPKKAKHEFGTLYGEASLKREGKMKTTWVTAHDTVIVDLDSFRHNDFDSLDRVLRRLTGYGADVILVTKAGAKEMLQYGRETMRNNRYKLIPGSRDVFVRSDSDKIPATIVATLDHMVEMGPIPARDISLIYQTDIAGVTENSGKAFYTEHGAAHIMSSTLLPFNYPSFGTLLPEHVDSVKARIAKAKSTLLAGVSDKAAQADLLRALDKVQLELDESGLYPVGSEIRIGDIIPLHDTATDRVILYRYGHTPLSREERMEGFEKGNMVLYGTELDPNVTALPGQITDMEPAGRGLIAMTLRVPVQRVGSKVIVEGTGYKITFGEIPESWGLEMPEFMPGVPVGALIATKDPVSKGSSKGVTTNFRNCFTYYGIDFRPEVAKALFGNDSPESVAQVEITLADIRSRMPRVSLEEAYGMMQRLLVNEPLLSVLPEGMGDLLVADEALARVKEDLRKIQPEPEVRITFAIITYLMWQDARVSDVLTSAGMSQLNNRDPQARLWEMPTLFTQVFDETTEGDPLRELVIAKLNARIPNKQTITITNGRTGDTQDVQVGFHIEPDLSVSHSNANPQFSGTGLMQFGRLIMAPTSIEADAQSGERTARQGSGVQVQEVFGAATGIKGMLDRDLPKTRALLDRSVTGAAATPAEMYAMYRQVKKMPNVAAWNNYSRAEREYILDGRNISEAWRQQLKKDEFEEHEVLAFTEKRNRIAAELGFSEAQAVIMDTWVRQHTGRPEITKKQRKKLTREQAEELTRNVTNPTYDQAMNALDMIQMNIRQGLLPTANAAQPRMHMLDLAALRDAAMASGKWAPVTKIGDMSSKATTWDEWVQVALAIGDVNNEYFDPMFLTASDAFLHSYMDSGLLFTGAPVSASESRAHMLASGRSLISDSPQRAELLNAPDADSIAWFIDPVIREAIDNRNRRTYAWRKKNQQSATPLGATQKDMVLHGIRLIDYGNNSSTILRCAVHLRAFNALFNPMLVVGAPFEAFIQNSLDDLADILNGTNIRFSRFTKAEREGFSKLYHVLGQDALFTGMIHDEFKQDSVDPEANRFEKRLAKLSAFAGRIQDPYYGMNEAQVARRYVTSVVRNAAALGRDTKLTPEVVMLNLMHNRTWVADNHPALHEMAMNTLKNTKCTKQTTMSTVWKNTLDPLTSSPRMGVAVPATLVRLQFMFANYGLNTAVRVLGLQGVDAFVAASLHGRQRGPLGKFFRKLVYGVAGVDDTPTTDEDVYDFSAALESVDLAREFAKSDITLTSLFAFGLAAGSLGLTGEDEEDRRRKRAARFKGAAYIYDPRDISNDFRNADAIYLDSFGPITELFRVTSDDEINGVEGHKMARMNFLVKQVMSPILGMERFLTNGNPMELKWGFEDAINSLPLIDTMGWQRASDSFDELMAAAESNASTGNPEDLPATYNFMLTAVYNLERMMLENSFINQLYIGADPYDRDPWALVEKTGVGQSATNRLGDPQRTGALDKDRDPETGEIIERYRTRDFLTAQHLSETEKKLGLALLTELFSMGKMDAFRTDMAIKTRRVDHQQLTTEEGMAVIKSIAAGADPSTLNLGSSYLTLPQREEIKAVLEKAVYEDAISQGMTEYEANGVVWDYFNADEKNPDAISLYDVIFSNNDFENAIPYVQSSTYMQRNTTYVKGPDGNFWATGVSLNLLNTFGQFAPLQRYFSSGEFGLPTDSRGNTVDDIIGVNTGMRGLERIEESFDIPEQESRAGSGSESDSDDDKSSGWKNYKRSGWRNFGRRSYRRGGGGGGGGGGGSFTRLNAPENNQTPYTNNEQMINANNVILRRAKLRRERSDSSKGRLKLWQ